MQGFGPDMSCAYDKTKQMMQINMPVSTVAPAGTTFVFTVDNFLNPYNGKPKGGYQIFTEDAVGGLSDSSVVADITLTVTVS